MSPRPNLSLFCSPDNENGEPTVNLKFISESLRYWGLQPRNIIRVIDRLSVFLDAWEYNIRIRLELVIPLLIADVMRIEISELHSHVPNKDLFKYQYMERKKTNNGEYISIRTQKSILEIFQGFMFALSQTDEHVLKNYNSDAIMDIITEIYYSVDSKSPIAKSYLDILRDYHTLIHNFDI